MSRQPRVPAGSPGGGQFASTECPRLYALLDTLAAGAPVPMATAAEPLLEVSPGHWRVYAPRCPHGHFRRWAQAADPKTGRPNCERCARSR